MPTTVVGKSREGSLIRLKVLPRLRFSHSLRISWAGACSLSPFRDIFSAGLIWADCFLFPSIATARPRRFDRHDGCPEQTGRCFRCRAIFEGEFAEKPGSGIALRGVAAYPGAGPAFPAGPQNARSAGLSKIWPGNSQGAVTCGHLSSGEDNPSRLERNGMLAL